MAYQKIDFHIQGVASLIMHNVQLANPTAEVVREIKKLTGKRKKTDQDHIDIANLEWQGGLYVDEKGRPVIPGENIESMLGEAARASRLGKAFKAGLFCDGEWPLIYDGPKTAEGLLGDPRFRIAKMMTVQRQRVLRTRPMFRNWELKFTVQFHPEVLNKSNVVEAVKYSAEMVGFGDSRPKYGRFRVLA